MKNFVKVIIMLSCMSLFLINIHFGYAEKDNLSPSLNDENRKVIKEKKRIFLELLPQTARDVSGRPIKSINKETIFVNQLIKDQLFEHGIKEISNQELGELFRIFFDQKNKPLMNNLAFFIAGRLHYLHSRHDVSSPILEKCKFGSFTNKYLPLIKKHLYLLKLKVNEQTMADYIGLHGQPSINKHNLMDLSHKDLTSLDGIHLIKNSKEVTQFHLNNNFILSSDLDPFFPIKPFQHFSNLEDLSLNSNQFQSINEDLFKGPTKLRFLFLVNNKIGKCSKKAFNHLTSLEMLYLNENRLKSLPEEIFYHLSKLQTLLLNSNQLQTLPEKILKDLKELDYIGLNYNCITHLPDKLFVGLPLLRSIDLSNNIMKRDLEEFWTEFHLPKHLVTVYFKDFKHITVEDALRE